MNCQAQAGLLETLYGFGLDTIQKTKELKRMLTNYRAPPESITNHVAPNQVKDATDEDFENIFQLAAFFQTLLKNFLEVTRS